MQKIANDQLETVATAGVFGHAIGDALGVPVEFQPRSRLKENSVTGMRGFGTHNQPAGTWSDDTSLTLCLAESLTEKGIDYHDQAKRFVGWMRRSDWTPHGRVFDIGNATREAILKLEKGAEPTSAGGTTESSNGNGSLMRILPLAIYLAPASTEDRIVAAMQCSRLTHGHIRSQLACAMFVEVAAEMVRGAEIADAVRAAQEQIVPLIPKQPAEQAVFAKLMTKNLATLPEAQISGSGYVIHCLEASLWCALNAKDYASGVLRAVNLGDDTDTTGAVTGGLLGLRFGLDAIPAQWRTALARRDDIQNLSSRFQAACERKWKENP